MKYFIQHKYKEEIFVPLFAITNNIEFLHNKEDEKICETSDRINVKARDIKEIHICSKEADMLVKTLYKSTMWDFVCKWYKVMPPTSMYFIRMKLETIISKEKEL